jgi:hypothetical protein
MAGHLGNFQRNRVNRNLAQTAARQRAFTNADNDRAMATMREADGTTLQRLNMEGDEALRGTNSVVNLMTGTSPEAVGPADVVRNPVRNDRAP